MRCHAARLLALVLLGLTAGPAISQAAAYELDAGHTRVHWEVDHMGISTTRGRIDQLSGAVWFDATSRQIDVNITADPASVSTGFAGFDKILRGSSLLAVESFPAVYFIARNASWQDGRLLELSGEITLRGISRPLSLRALRFGCGFNPLFRREVCGGDFEGRIKRSEFDMTLALPLVADEVRLLVQVEGVRAP